MLKKLLNYLELASAYVCFNIRAQWEYRTAFLSQAVAMFVNDCIWLAYFAMLFHHFPIIHGWRTTDVAILWAVTAAGFGLAHGFFGNALQLAALIARGELDVWLLYPRALLPHLILGRMNPSAIGDAVFGYIIYIVFVHPDLPHFLLFSLLTFSVAMVLLGVSITAGSLSFFFGNAETLAENWRSSVIAFSTYPTALFEGKVKLLMFTVIPAAFISGFPIQALQQMSLLHAAYSLAGALTIVSLSVVVFYRGLRHYESGNIVALRG